MTNQLELWLRGHDRPTRLDVAFADWCDIDVAAYLLGRMLGMFQGQDFRTDAKSIFWSDNRVGEKISSMLYSLI